MPLTDADYNAFAQALANRFAARAKGLDEDSQQIVGLRPADHILAGFLTPAAYTRRQTTDDDTEAALAEDLPKDEPYEQSAIGLEWIAPNCSVARRYHCGNRGSCTCLRPSVPIF